MRDARIYLDDILSSVSRIRSYIGDMTFSEFEQDQKTQDAVIRNLEIIGEAVGKLPEHIFRSNPQVEWQKIKALRNILVHEYFGIHFGIVWDVIQNKLEQLEASCTNILEDPGSEADPSQQ